MHGHISKQTHLAQHGAALITSLVILLVLTILGISAMKNSSLQENIVGNLRDHDMAFQAAEAALTAAENNTLTILSVPQLDPNSSGSNGVYPRAVPGDMLFDLSSSAYNTSVWSNATTATHLADAAADPGYIIQFEQFVPDSFDPDTLAHKQGLVYYRVTSRGFGTSQHSAVLLQEVFGKRNR